MKKRKILPFGTPIIQHIPEDVARLGILWGMEDYSPITQAYLNVYAPEIVLKNGKHILDVKINYDIPKISVKKVPRDILNDVLAWVEKAIFNEYYVLMSIDSCKIRAYRRYNPRGCFPHKIFIYGVDGAKKIAYCADFFDGNKYSCIQISYNELIESIQSLAIHSDSINYSTGGADWITDIELLKYLPNYKEEFNRDMLRNGLSQFLEGKNIYGYSKCTYERPHIMAKDENDNLVDLYEIKGKEEYYGISVFKRILNYYEENRETLSIYTVGHKMLYLVYAYHKLMYFRLVYIKEQGWISCESWEDIIERYERLVERSKRMLNVGLKYEFTRGENILNWIIEELEYNISESTILLNNVINALDEKWKEGENLRVF